MLMFDASPTVGNSSLSIGEQSVSGRALCIATSTNAERVYLGGTSGVWRSDDKGANWTHMEWPQPPPGSVTVPGCLPVPTILDLAVHPADPGIVLASAGVDARVPSQSGVYRSTDFGASWTLVHTFQKDGIAGIAATLRFAPDNADLVYAAGQFAVGISQDGGATWTDSVPIPIPNTNPVVDHFDGVWHVGVAAAEGSQRRVYAAGNVGVWYSVDGGASWGTQTVSGPGLTRPAVGIGVSSRALCVHPTNPAIVYILDRGRNLWKGDYTAFATTGKPVWTELPAVPRGAGRTASGTSSVIAVQGAAGTPVQLIAADQERVYVSMGEPATSDDWVWIDSSHHPDPHGLAVSAFDRGADTEHASGRLFAVNDGGAYVSSDGARSWTHGAGLATLTVVNVSINARTGQPPVICFGTGDNWGFFSGDGGASWKTQEYDGGDNDCSFTDPQQSHRLIVFAPRDTPNSVHLYAAAAGQVPDGAVGTGDLHVVPGPLVERVRPDGAKWGWNAVSWWFNMGYRPVVLTVPGESPRTDGDFVVIRFLTDTSMLLRTTALSQISSSDDWTTTAMAETAGVHVFQQGPLLPDRNASVVQVSGGHEAPVFYIGDPEVPVGGHQRVWKWTAGMADWQLLVPGNQASAAASPRLAQRFFVDPYRPNRIYVLDEAHVLRSEDGGGSWTVDASLESCLTENGAFPFVSIDDGSAQPVLLRDMNFDPLNANYRFAVGIAGVFYTLDGVNWDHLLLASASGIQPTNSTYDIVSDPCNRSLYVATSNRGVLRLSPLPPDWDFPLGSLIEVSGRVLFLRVNDVGTGYGPPDDSIDAEVIFQLDSQPGKAFGFQLRKDDEAVVNRGKLNLLRLAYARNVPVLIDFTRTSCRNGTVVRVALQ